MDELKTVFAENLTRLRVAAGMTQLELAQKLNYSDKSVSKWERGEGIPDLIVTKSIADLFGVTVDFLITPHTEKEVQTAPAVINTRTVTAVTMLGIWTAAAVAFISVWIALRPVWLIFFVTLPLSLVTLLVLNSVWDRKKAHPVIVSLLIVSVLLLLFMIFIESTPWQLFLLIPPALAIVWLSFRIKRKREG